MPSVAEQIEARLKAEWPDADVAVVDESHLHAGHAGARPEGETHFHVTIANPAFAPLSRVERHRAIHGRLDDLLKGPIHALRLTIAP